MNLGLALAQSRRIAPTLLTQLEQSAREKRTQLIDELVSSGIMSAHDLAVFVAGKYQMPLLDLAQYKLDTVPAVLSANKHFQQLRLLPLGRRDNRIIVATSDPSDPKPIEELRQKMNVAIETVIVEHDKLVRQLSLANEAPTEIKSLIPKQEATQIEYDDPGAAATVRRTTTDGIDDAPVVHFLQKLFTEALLRGTSDLHFEPFETFYRVRFRIDGILAQVAQPPLDIRDKIATRIKVLSRLDISERRVPQDGRMKLLITVPKDKNDKDNKETIERAIDFRVSTLPTLFGEKIVIRILESSTERLDIDQLGYEPEQKQLLLDVIKRPYGMVLVTGPTGSGKTVSLYTFLNKLNQGDINISTAEDPAEIQLPGINQVNVNDKAGLTFAAALKSFLRQDPDIIMVGEIRDLETADISIKAAQTGHLVFSTLHTNDAPTTLTRLMNMGVAPFNIASSVLMITAQRLGRRLCKACKKPGPLPRETLLDAGFKEADLDGSWQPYHPVGCEACNGSGYKGRVGIYQVMPITEAIQEIILSHGTALQIAEQARKEGVLSLRDSGLRKVKQGLTSLEEVLATTNQ
ncbi:type IV-A pilus assembly ATPase PilB [Ralstonia syzygii]|uniref:type IV-A pilus assembly ATPase PilB n=1 Tax=Ralstonia syzygii TaxID=28097 RepID=UPI0018D13BF2|nr:type IV-A pilus assembly ATPase PilB [Ralstonia syzygii]